MTYAMDATSQYQKLINNLLNLKKMYLVQIVMKKQLKIKKINQENVQNKYLCHKNVKLQTSIYQKPLKSTISKKTKPL